MSTHVYVETRSRCQVSYCVAFHFIVLKLNISLNLMHMDSIGWLASGLRRSFCLHLPELGLKMCAHCGGGEWKNGWLLSVAFTVTHIWGDGLHTLKQLKGFQQCKGICFGSPACELIAALIPATTSGSRYYPLPFEEWNDLQEDFWDFSFLSLWWGPGVTIPQDPGIFVTQASGLLDVESQMLQGKVLLETGMLWQACCVKIFSISRRLANSCERISEFKSC